MSGHEGSSLLVLADDQVAFRVPGHGSVVGFRGALADQDHRAGHPWGPPLRPAPRTSQCASGAQRPGQLATQLAPTLQIEGLIDGFVGHLHLRTVGEVSAQSARISTPLRRIRTGIGQCARMAVTSDFASDGRRAALKFLGNHPIAGVLA